MCATLSQPWHQGELRLCSRLSCGALADKGREVAQVILNVRHVSECDALGQLLGMDAQEKFDPLLGVNARRATTDVTREEACAAGLWRRHMRRNEGLGKGALAWQCQREPWAHTHSDG